MKIDERMKELIAIGASITANCQPCLEYHAGKALELEADPEDAAVSHIRNCSWRLLPLLLAR